jgi:hypothetical protein
VNRDLQPGAPIEKLVDPVLLQTVCALKFQVPFLNGNADQRNREDGHERSSKSEQLHRPVPDASDEDPQTLVLFIGRIHRPVTTALLPNRMEV